MLLVSMGQAIRTRRRGLNLTLRDVQERTGLSSPFLSKLERGLSRPSMRTLTSIADVLGTTAHALVTIETDEDVGEVRIDQSLEVEHGRGAARPLVRGEWPFVPVEYRSGPEEFEEFYVHPGHEVMYVAEGTCQMEIQGRGVFDLNPGESVFYGPNVQHRWRQVSKGPIRVLLIQANLGEVGRPS